VKQLNFRRGAVVVLSALVLIGCAKEREDIPTTAVLEKYVTGCEFTFSDIVCITVDGDSVQTRLANLIIVVPDTSLEGTMVRVVYDPRKDYNWDFGGTMKPLRIGYALGIAVLVRSFAEKDAWKSILNSRTRPRDVLPSAH